MLGEGQLRAPIPDIQEMFCSTRKRTFALSQNPAARVPKWEVSTTLVLIITLRFPLPFIGMPRVANRNSSIRNVEALVAQMGGAIARMAEKCRLLSDARPRLGGGDHHV